MPFNPSLTFSALLQPEGDADTWTSFLMWMLGSYGVTPGTLSVSLANSGAPTVIPPMGLTVTASGGWSFQSTNPAPVTLTSSSPTGLLFVVTQTGTSAITAGTTLTGYPALPGITATAMGAPVPGKGQGFPVANWKPKGSAASIVRAMGAALVAPGAVIAALAGSATLTTAPGNPTILVNGQSSNQTWLDLAAYSKFGVQRFTSVNGQYAVTLSAASGKGPYTISPQAMWLKDPATGNRYQSTNTAPATIPQGGSTTLTFQAENPGTAYNANVSAPGYTLTQVTPLLGVSAVTANIGGGSSVIIAGADAELDARMIQRCQTQWATLTTAATFQTIINRALNFDKTITSVFIDDQNPLGPGTFTVYLASATGTYSGTSGFAAFLAAYEPLDSIPNVVSASAIPLTVSGTVYIPSANKTAVQAAITAALGAYQQGLQIGDGITSSCGVPIPTAQQTGAVRVSDIYNVCMAAGAAYVDLSTPASDTAPSKGAIITLTNSLVFTAV